ncbi:MAG: PLDc_N domain-containing protein [Campylobacteraceae bacterium]|mgnify:FL=1|jgi:hypothetical protein|nr:PLDc_N domain-containing protein [Campylobacteraceae bacterium]MBT3882080.1 PLDc_N domain-containing protein [Campylobacteraceae bacterium]MBT4031282.1 PLDc_N domain-containing protein [Campylobacteraceae bacterium]MBT4572196.1 PLDc_N domain-containing protein [Campylobacteraceae bacterium]MBT4707462.1 PLDc_N domain-containing protein [Campylobacteraceae bacterium]
MEFLSIIYFGMLIFWIWALVDVLKSKFDGGNKIVWLLAILFLNIFGAILYVIIGRKHKVI